MGFPASVKTCTLSVGAATDFTGQPLSLTVVGRIVLGGTATHLVHAATGGILADTMLRREGGPGAPVELIVPAVDQPGFQSPDGTAVTGWAYLLEVTVGGPQGYRTWTKSVQPLAEQSFVDVDLLPSAGVTSVVHAPIPAVTSVNGQTGPVTLTIPDTSALTARVAAVESGKADRQELADGLASRADQVHQHTISQVVGLQNALDDKARISQLPTPAQLVPTGGRDGETLTPAGWQGPRFATFTASLPAGATGPQRRQLGPLALIAEESSSSDPDFVSSGTGLLTLTRAGRYRVSITWSASSNPGAGSWAMVRDAASFTAGRVVASGPNAAAGADSSWECHATSLAILRRAGEVFSFWCSTNVPSGQAAPSITATIRIEQA